VNNPSIKAEIIPEEVGADAVVSIDPPRGMVMTSSLV